MLSLHTIAPNTLELLKNLSSIHEFRGMRLVGGTALALQYGHRQSIDLDFFGSPIVEQDILLSKIEHLGNIVIRVVLSMIYYALMCCILLV